MALISIKQNIHGCKVFISSNTVTPLTHGFLSIDQTDKNEQRKNRANLHSTQSA